MISRLMLASILLAGVVSAQAAEYPRFLLDDTDAVITVNMKQIRASAAFQKHYVKRLQGWLQGKGEMAAALRAIKVDPAKDIDWIVVANGESLYRASKITIGKKVVIHRRGGTFILVEGRFQPDLIRKWADQTAKTNPDFVKAHQDGAVRYYEVQLGRSMFVGVLNANMLAFSSYSKPIIEALAKAAGAKRTMPKHRQIFTTIPRLSAKNSVNFLALGNMVYFVDLQAAKQGNRTVERRVAYTLAGAGGIESVNGDITVSDGVAANFNIVVRDAATAKAVAETLQRDQTDSVELLFAAVLKYEWTAPFLNLVRSIQIARPSAKTVRVSGKVDADELATALGDK